MKKILLSAFIAMGAAASAQNSWVEQATKFSTSFGVDEISIVDQNTVWVNAYDGSGSGTYPKQVSRTTNGGATWTSVTIPTSQIPSNGLISDIHAIDGQTAYIAVAIHAYPASTNGIWKTTNGGTTWVKQTSGFGSSNDSFANQIYFWDANNGWAAGDPVGGKFEMYKTSNGGTTWTAVASAPTPLAGQGTEYSYVGVKDVVGDNIWIGTDLGRILHSPDRGTTWNAYFTPALDFGGITTSGSSAKMAFSSGTKGLLLTVDNDSDAALYETSDSGATWEPLEPSGPWYFGDITYVPGTPNTYVSTGINYTDDSWLGSSYSNDGGHNWIEIDAGEQRGAVKFLNSTTGWAGQFSDGPSGTKGILKFQGSVLATSDVAVKSNLKVFPNPAVDVVTVSSNKDVKKVTVYDVSGKKVTSAEGNKVNVSSLAKGNYILQVYYGNGAVENTKLIKK